MAKKISKKECYVTVCPKCGSDDVQAEKDAAYAWTCLMNSFKQCNNCGYHGQVFPEIPESKVAKKPLEPKQVKDKQMVQTSFGRGYSKFISYVLFPLAIIFLIIWFFMGI